MAIYKIKLITNGKINEFECADDVLILDKAENEKIDLPYSCRSGSCSSCAGRILKGKVNQDEQNFLSEKQISQGYVLLCAAYPEADCIIKTHIENELLDNELENDFLWGKGKWVIIDIDKFSLKNAAIWILQRLSTLEPGKVPGDREFWHTEQTVTLEWVPSSDPRSGYHTFGEHLYGEIRTVNQTYLPKLLPNGNFKMNWEPNLLSELD